MKQKLVIIATIIMIALSARREVRAQFSQVNTPLVDSINDLEIGVFCFASSDSALFAGTYQGVIRSTDSGLNWNYANSGMNQNVLVNALIVIGSGSTTLVFAGTDSGVYRSTDFGRSWSLTSNGLTNDTVNAFGQLSNGSTNILFAGTNNGLFRSTDSGASWAATDSGLKDSSISCFATLGKIIFAGSNRQFPSNGAGLFRSSDEGKSWTWTDTNLFAEGVISMTVSGTVTSSILFVSVFDNGFVCSSTDSGLDWEIQAGQTYAPTSMLVHGDTLFVVAGLLEYTTDNGLSWNLLFDQIGAHNYVTSIIMADSYFFLGAYSGIWRASWGGESNVELGLSPNSTLIAYPNPLTQSTTISFSSPESAVAEVTIVNLLGTQVARLFEGELAAGEHEFRWNAAGFAPGTYWAIVRMNGKVEQVPVVSE